MIKMTKQEEIMWEWVRVCEYDGYETYTLRPFTVTRRAFVYSHSEVQFV